MNTIELESFAVANKDLKPYFKGVYAIDQLPPQVISSSRPYGIILNLCESTIVSENCHWVGIWVSPDRVFYFDSAGETSFNTFPAIQDFCFRHGKIVSGNKNPLQSPTSDKCGMFVLCFLHAASIGISFQQFLNCFYNIDSLEENDRVIVSIFQCSFVNAKDLIQETSKCYLAE